MKSSAYDSPMSRQNGVTLGQRLAAVFLAAVSVISFLCVASQRDNARYWRQRAVAAEATLARIPTQGDRVSRRASSTNGYYDALLVGVDGEVHPISGKALQIFTGKDSMFEIEFDRQEKGRLLVWSPSYKEDEYFHRIIVRPACSNVLDLELEKVSLSGNVGSLPGSVPLYQARTTAVKTRGQ